MHSSESRKVTWQDAYIRISIPSLGYAGMMHANAIRTLLHGMGCEHITRHGFRSSFRDWAGECTHYPREVCAMALAHDEHDQTEGAYSRSDFLDKRRLLMNDWSRFVSPYPTAA